MAENNLVALKGALGNDSIKNKFAELLGKKSAGFLTSITNVVQNNDLLQKAEVNSIILAAAQAASLDLPINPNLGFSAIIPFNVLLYPILWLFIIKEPPQKILCCS